MKNMKAGDIIVAQFTKAADEAVNATYSEKYTYDNMFAYIVDADGDVELKFTRVSSSGNNYFYGIYAYTHNVTGTAVGAFDNTTGDRAATSEKGYKSGESLSHIFKNYNSCGGNSNFEQLVLLALQSKRREQIAVRADNFEIQTGRILSQ